LSLTKQLDDVSSPIRLWMDKRFPELGKALKTVRTGLPSDLRARTIPTGAGVPPPTIGVAIDYRIRYHFAITPSDKLVAFHGASIALAAIAPYATPSDLWAAEFGPAAFFQALDQLLVDIDPVGRVLDASSEERLDRVCVVLALFEEVYRSGPVRPTSLLASLPIRASAHEILALIPRSWTDDIAAVCSRVLAEVPLEGTAVLNPTFSLGAAIGGADADLILDRCLIEIKATVNPGVEMLGARQLLGYMLLDTADAFHIEALGLLRARQAVMVRWPLEPFLDEAAGARLPPLDVIRAEFAEAVSARRDLRVDATSQPG
jgi:hypothetical protein